MSADILQDNLEDNVYKMGDIDRANYLKEMNVYFKVLDNYYNDTKNYTKSLMNYAFAALAVNHYTNKGISFDTKNLSELSKAQNVVFKDLINEKSLPYLDGTQMLIDALKPIDISYKYGVATPSILKEEADKWHDVTIKNVDFKKVENAIDSKDILNYIHFNNCKFIDCQTNNLKYFKISENNNEIMNNTKENFSIRNSFNNIKSKTVDKLKSFGLIASNDLQKESVSVAIKPSQVELPQKKEPEFLHSKMLSPHAFEKAPDNKICINIPVRNNDNSIGYDKYFIPKPWVRLSRNCFYLSIPKNHEINDITVIRANETNREVVKVNKLISDTNKIFKHANFRPADDVKNYYNKLMDEKPISAKGFHDFAKENEKQTKKVSLKTKPQTKENDLGNSI